MKIILGDCACSKMRCFSRRRPKQEGSSRVGKFNAAQKMTNHTRTAQIGAATRKLEVYLRVVGEPKYVPETGSDDGSRAFRSVKVWLRTESRLRSSPFAGDVHCLIARPRANDIWLSLRRYRQSFVDLDGLLNALFP